jgi:putative ABC transport system permease protein
MFLLAWRHGRLDPLRTALTALALGAVIAVILVLEGFEQGLYFQLERAVLDRQSGLIAAEPGVANFLVGGSSLPQLSREEVESVPGVAGAHPITLIPVIYEKAGVRTPIIVFVTDGKGGPARIVAGRDVTEDRDIVVDVSLAAIYGIRVGDPLVVSDFEFTVSGIAERDAALFVPFAFISYDGMIDFFLDSEIAPDISTFPLLSFLLIEHDPSVDRGRLAAAIEERVPSVAVFTPEQMARQDAEFGRAMFGPILGVLVMVGYLIGLLVAGLILYADVTGRLHGFGVMKALGYPFRRLAQAVIAQALVLLAMALPIGIALAQALAALVTWAAPLYAVRIFEPAALAQTIVASLAFAIAGALIPLASIRRIDPMVAFQRS